jgi:hypothetical protein
MGYWSSRHPKRIKKGKKMKKMLLTATAAFAAFAATPATAAQFITISGPSGNYGDDEVTAGAFTRTFTFTQAMVAGFNLSAIDFSSVATSAFTDLTIASVTFNGVSLNTLSSGTFDYRNLGNQPILGTNTIIVTGTSGGNGSFTGNLAFTAIQAVPEPGTWALMLLGFGVVGYSMRRRPQISYVSAV